jgi:hypothetical protein
MAGCEKVSAQKLDDGEQIQVLIVAQDRLEATIDHYKRIGFKISSRVIAYMIGKGE